MSNQSNSSRTPESSQSGNSSHSIRKTTILTKIKVDATPKVKEVATLLPREKFARVQSSAKEAEHKLEDSVNNASISNGNGLKHEIEGKKNKASCFPEFKLFPEEHDKRFPTYASVFGQPKYMNPFADEDAQKHRKGGIQSTYDGKFTNIPDTVLKDRYGMMGLLSIMRTAKSLPEMTLLSLGDDLESYGFDLNSEDMLYCNFNGPYTNEPPPKYLDRGFSCEEALKKLRLGSTAVSEEKRK